MTELLAGLQFPCMLNLVLQALEQYESQAYLRLLAVEMPPCKKLVWSILFHIQATAVETA